LKLYLNESSNLFRTFLPWRPYIFDTIFQTQWYYDELIVFDPIVFEINNFRTGNIQDDKIKLQQLLVFLNSMKDSINAGFLLFGSYDTFNNIGNLEDNKFDSLISVPEIRNECDRLVQVFKMINTDGKEKSYFQIASKYRNKQTLFSVVKDFDKLKNEEGLFGITYDFINSQYILQTVDDAKKEGYYDRAYDVYKEDYAFEIKEILNYIDIGSGIKTPILFDRKLDEMVLSNISLEKKIVKSKGNDYFKLFLPFINGIPPAKLFEIRSEMPTAFIDFRNLMFDIIYEYENTDIDTQVLELRIQSKINPLLRSLDAEMKNSVSNAKIMGLGLPIVSGIGALGLWSYGVDVSKYAELLIGGVNIAGMMKGLSNYLTEQNVGKPNSLYYLWKVLQ